MHIYKILMLILTTILLAGCVNSNTKTLPPTKQDISDEQQTLSEEVHAPDPLLLSETINTLTETHRATGTEEAHRVAEWLKAEAQKYNYTVKSQEFKVYKQDVKSFLTNCENLNPFNQELPIHTSHNIIAERESSLDTNKTIIVSAHYDSTSESKGVIDNASGTAVVLELLRVLKDCSLPFNIKFIFFGSEEYFLTGSRSYIAQLTEEEKADILGCLNIDMIGLKDQDKFVLSTPQGTSNTLTTQMVKLMDSQYIQGTLFVPGESDHVTFLKAGIPAFNFCDNYRYLDTSNDDSLDNLDINRLKIAVQTLADAIIAIDPIDSISKHEQVIDPKKLSDIFNVDFLFENIPTGYELVETKEILLPNKLASKVMHIFENNNNDRLVVTQKYTATDPFTPEVINVYANNGFTFCDKGYWVNKDTNPAHIAFEHSLIQYEFEGNIEDIEELSSHYLK